ncbi:PKD domain-containing protein [Methanosarcina sp. UBA411]|uniref:PKD domain-containing protein n=1 Tax=Methanosarcina sp. UBA411 TaxID=1915589 RepID=UPI0025DFAAD8|nr:PKD domain-containing protein [Methanosarcina sp. UBA411]
MKNNRKFIWKITVSVFTVLMILTLLSAGASAKCTVTPTPLGAGTPPATARLSCGNNHIDYTAVAASSSDPRIVQFKDLSKGKETYIRWDFGDGTHLEGTKITPALKNPVHKYSKTGYYISCMTIKCNGCVGKLWVHKNVVIK